MQEDKYKYLLERVDLLSARVLLLEDQLKGRWMLDKEKIIEKLLDVDNRYFDFNELSYLAKLVRKDINAGEWI